LTILSGASLWKEMTIRKAKVSEFEKLAELNKKLIEDERHPNPMSAEQLVQRMSEWLQGEYVCYVVEKDEQTIAYCLYRDDGEYYFMRQLFVDREHRRRGIATAFLDWMYQHIWLDKKVRLDVLSHNEEAIAFYKAYGFRIGCLRMEK
jgi:ribosomal protein S18 acetylase RimI-like enzyme